jgi:mevalonate kinase
VPTWQVARSTFGHSIFFHTGASTVNFALSLRARVRIETREDDQIILESRDRGVRVETTTDRIDDLADDERLELVSKMVHFFRPQTGFHLVANSEAPAGAGFQDLPPWRLL